MKTCSNALTHYLREKIAAAGGALSFDQFMTAALYHPEFGYYNSPHFTIGKEGDFTTAPEISPLFAQCLAQQCQEIFTQLKAPNILELGAGTGRMALDLLMALQKLNCLPEHYFIYEPNMHLRQKQQAFLKMHTPPVLFSRLEWLAQLPEHLHAVVIANEVLDALPVQCFEITADGIKERCVSYEHNGFHWQHRAPTPDLLEKVTALRDTYALDVGYASEINLQLPPFIQAVANALDQGVILLIDYGYGEREYYHPARNQGTLTCFYQHQHHDNPLINIGLQDITAHVNFTQVADCAIDADCQVLGYTTQTAFLLACGLMELAAAAEKNLSPVAEFQLHQAVKLLTMPTEMGERVKVMALGKGLSFPLMGFRLQDRRRDL